MGNNEDNCSSPDSRIGIGTQGDTGSSTNIAVGNSAGWMPCCFNSVNIESFGVVFVR